MNPIIVSAAMIRDKNKILLGQRKPDSHLALKWEFPGGKLEAGESPEECLQREIKEELDMDISVGRIFEVIFQDYGNRSILLLCYEAFIKDGVPRVVDCHDFKWVDKEELLEMDLAEADRIIAKRLAQEK